MAEGSKNKRKTETPTTATTSLPAWTRSVRGWRIVGILVLILLATQLRYSERRAIHERDKATVELAAAQNRFATEREQFRSDLKVQTDARLAAEAERDRLKAALQLAPTSDGASPAQTGAASSDPSRAPRYPGIARADLAHVMPRLVAALRPADAGNKKGLRIDEASELPVELQRIGIQKGDIITNIDRIHVTEVAPFADALASYQKGAGFALRLVRAGQSMWLRVNILDDPATPPPMDAPAPEDPEEAAPEEPEEAPPS